MAPSIVLTVVEPPAHPQVGPAGISSFTPQMCACAAPTWVWRAASRGSLKSMTRGHSCHRWRSWASARGARRKGEAKWQRKPELERISPGLNFVNETKAGVGKCPAPCSPCLCSWWGLASQALETPRFLILWEALSSRAPSSGVPAVTSTQTDAFWSIPWVLKLSSWRTDYFF